MNGVQETAEWTSFHRTGDAVIDFIWIPLDLVSKVMSMKVWDEDEYMLGDHAMVSISLRMSHGPKKQEAVISTGYLPRKRWNTVKPSVIPKLREACHHKLHGWSPGLVVSAGCSGDRVEMIWRNWQSRVIAAAEEGLGYRTSMKPRPQDRQLAKSFRREMWRARRGIAARERIAKLRT